MIPEQCPTSVHLTLYRPEAALILPSLRKPNIKTLKLRFGWIREIDFDFSSERKSVFFTGSVVAAHESIATEKVINVRCKNANLASLGFQHAEYLLIYQNIYLSGMGNADRLWFRDMRVVENETGGTYYPTLFRQRPHGRFTKWRFAWTHDFDSHTNADRIAFSRKP